MALVPCLRHWRRLLTRSAFGLALAGSGAALFILLPAAPRWSVTGPARSFVADEGPALATYMLGGDTACGPVQLWDLATGLEQEQFLADEPAFLTHTPTRDGRYFIAVLPRTQPNSQRIAWVDLRERRAWHVETQLGEFDSAEFSRTCDYLAVRLRKIDAAQAAYTIVETATGRVLARFSVPCRAPTRKDEFWGRWSDSVDDGVFTDDGRFFAVNRSDGGESAMYLVETRTGNSTRIPDARLRALVPDSRSLIAERDGAAWIWDLETMDWRVPLEADAPDTLRFSADSRWVASVPPDRKEPVPLRFFDLRTGRLHWEFQSITCNSENVQEERFAPDGCHFLMPTEVAPGQRRITMLDVPNKRVLWEHTYQAPYGICVFTADSRTLIHGLPAQLEAADVASGETHFTVVMPQSVSLDPWLSRDGRTLYVLRQPGPAEPTLGLDLLEDYWPWPHNDLETAMFPLHAHDLATGRERWRLESTFATQIRLGEDHVVTLHHHEHNGVRLGTTIQCWDVPPRKRWEWIIGTPACVGAALLIGRAGCRRVRRRATSRTPPS